jgi:phosphoserine phosphatase
MENGDPGAVVAKDGQTERSTVVISMFSKTPRTQDEWERLAHDLLNSLDAWIGNSARPLDQDAAKFGSVYEMHATNSDTKTRSNLSLEICSSLRRSDGVQNFEKNAEVEVIIQPTVLYQTHMIPGLAVFDMDSTLIQQEVIDELARSVGRYEQVAAVTESAMRGELNFEESLKARVAHLDGVSTDVWEYMKANVITFTPGAPDLIKVLKRLGWKTAVLSGGFTPLAYWLRDTLGLDYAYANQLATDPTGSKLTGELLPDAPIVGPNLKRDTLLRLAADNKIPISHTIAVGDGSNDLLMIQAAGLGIAFNAKPKVQAASPARLNSKSLLDILHVLGLTAEDIQGLLK